MREGPNGPLEARRAEVSRRFEAVVMLRLLIAYFLGRGGKLFRLSIDGANRLLD